MWVPTHITHKPSVECTGAPPAAVARILCWRARVNAAADFEARALVVEYQVEAAVLNDVGDVIQVDTRPHRKV